MEEKLKKKCMKQRMVILVVLGIIGVVMLAVSKLAIFDLIGGPKKIGKDTDYDSLKGKYVSFNMQLPLCEYERVSSKNEDTNVTTLKQIAYVVYDPDNDCYVGVMKYKASQSEMDKKMDQAWDYLYGDTDELPASEVIKGTLTVMDSTDKRYFEQRVDELSDYFPEKEGVLYYINAEHVRGVDTSGVIALTVFGVLIIVCGAVYVLAAKKDWDKDVEKYLQKHPELDRGMLERDIASAKDFNGKSVYCGKRWIFVADSKVKVYDGTQYVWGYYYRRTGRNSVSQARLFDLNKKMAAINMSESEAKALLGYMYEMFPQIVVGYDRDWEKMYNKNFNEFLNLRYNAAKANERQENPQDEYFS